MTHTHTHSAAGLGASPPPREAFALDLIHTKAPPISVGPLPSIPVLPFIHPSRLAAPNSHSMGLCEGVVVVVVIECVQPACLLPASSFYPPASSGPASATPLPTYLPACLPRWVGGCVYDVVCFQDAEPSSGAEKKQTIPADAGGGDLKQREGQGQGREGGQSPEPLSECERERDWEILTDTVSISRMGCKEMLLHLSSLASHDFLSTM